MRTGDDGVKVFVAEVRDNGSKQLGADGLLAFVGSAELHGNERLAGFVGVTDEAVAQAVGEAVLFYAIDGIFLDFKKTVRARFLPSGLYRRRQARADHNFR